MVSLRFAALKAQQFIFIPIEKPTIVQSFIDTILLKHKGKTNRRENNKNNDNVTLIM